MANHKKSNPRPRYTADDSMTALCVWEHMLGVRGDPDRGTMLKTWNNVGTWGMRQLALDVIAPWVNKVCAFIEKQAGETGDELTAVLGMDSWDWEFVPAVMERIDWTEQGCTPRDACQTGAVMIAEAALGVDLVV